MLKKCVGFFATALLLAGCSTISHNGATNTPADISSVMVQANLLHSFLPIEQMLGEPNQRDRIVSSLPGQPVFFYCNPMNHHGELEIMPAGSGSSLIFSSLFRPGVCPSENTINLIKSGALQPF